ncbi:site-specific integrase [Methylotenera sp.]|uniref:site-specific integrase n=1 Tax=Methylotenera sp. TaxID=2051956 RepID=UPI00273400DD|nr:site-specific integrase [Methylotenera sp.]MDP3308624.1 site-specific integrase [Methylotenera sp.]
MNNIRNVIHNSTDQLPQYARTRSGIEYEVLSDLWSFRDGTCQFRIDFRLVPILASPLVIGLKLTLIWYLEHRAAKSAENYFVCFIRFLRNIETDQKIPITRITPEHIISFKMISNSSEFTLSQMSGFLKKWVNLNSPGIDKNVAILLGQLKLKQNPVGVAVATLNPQTGPLTDLEFENIQCALVDSYANGQIDDEKFLLAFLFIALGARPVQLASLKLCDLLTPQENQDKSEYALMVPRAKQREQLSRDEHKVRILAYQLGEPLHRYVNSVYTQFANKLSDPWHAPMFPQRKQLQFANATGFEFHRAAGSLSAIIVTVFKKLGVKSERLNGPIPVAPIRFRRTFATRAAEEGLPLLVIAEMMDHTDTRHVEVYSGLTSRIRARLSRAIAMHMAPIAQAFSGHIIKSEAEAIRPNASSRIVDLRVDQSGGGIGSCSSHAFCGFAKPIACYSCNSFEPWLDGPHETMLDYLLERRDYLNKTTDPRIASINDRSILGCAQVILRCREIKKNC